MANNRLWLVHRRTGKRVMLAKHFDGWSTLGDLDEKLNQFFDGDEYIYERDDFALDMEHWDVQGTPEDRLLARVERLRAALQEIENGVDTCGEAMSIAEVALAEDDREAAR